MYDIKQTMRINMLLDFYSELLTDKQKKVMDFYFRDDLSLSEIAENESVSRNAVHDNVTRTLKVLENYEEKLLLLDKFQKRDSLFDQLRNLSTDDAVLDLITKLEELE